MKTHTRSHRRLLVPAALCAAVVVVTSTPGAGAAVRHVTASPVRGGTLRIGYSGSMVSFDPALADNDDYGLVLGALSNGLYQFDRHGVAQLDLAADAPAISPDRKTWTFHIRKGVLFHNGMEVTADDVKFSLTRVLDPHLKPAISWGQTTDEIFQGWQDFVNGKAKSVSGIQVLDRYTIRFVLQQPLAVLPDILAESFNFIVPKAVVLRESPGEFASHPIGTGPFMLQSWQKGVQVTLVRNPRYFHPGKPYLDRIVAYTNLEPSLITLKIEKGEISGFGWVAEVPAADLQQLSSDPRYARYLVPAPITNVLWLDLDVHTAPFDTPAMRQAVAMAIDRGRLVQLLGGNAVPATQLYDPLFPQYDPALARTGVYGYDPQKAAALVKAGGYHGQPITVLYANDFAPAVAMAPAFQQDLQRIGLHVDLRGVTFNTLATLAAPLTGHQISFGNWNIDFLDAFDTYSATMSCSGNIAGSTVSGAHYCDPRADDLVNRAQDLPLGPRRDALMRQAQLPILRSATKIPLVFLKSAEIVSPKVAGFYYAPIVGWQFENYWLQR